MIGLKQNDFIIIAKSNNAKLSVVCHPDNPPVYFLEFVDGDNNRFELVTASNEARAFSSLDTVIKFCIKHFRVNESLLTIPVVIENDKV